MDCYFVNYQPTELKPAASFKEAIAELLGFHWHGLGDRAHRCCHPVTVCFAACIHPRLVTGSARKLAWQSGADRCRCFLYRWLRHLPTCISALIEVSNLVPLFFFCLIWSVGATCDAKSRKGFNDLAEGQDSIS